MAETQKPDNDRLADPSHYEESSARENLIEHVFLGELLRGLWRKNVRDLEVLRPEVDSGGSDLRSCHGRQGMPEHSTALLPWLAERPSLCWRCICAGAGRAIGKLHSVFSL